MYTRRKFRPLYAKVMKKSALGHRNSSAFIKNCSNAMTLITKSLQTDDQEPDLSRFDFPFNELFVSLHARRRSKLPPRVQRLHAFFNDSSLDLGSIDEEAKDGFINVATRRRSISQGVGCL